MGFKRITVVAVVGLSLALSACGRDGALQPPPGPEGPPPEGAQPEPKPEEQRDFLLDFLIQ